MSVLKNSDGLEFQDPTDLLNMWLRLTTGFLFHLSNFTDISDSFLRLKYLTYNPDKIVDKYFSAAFLLTQMQFWISIFCSVRF